MIHGHLVLSKRARLIGADDTRGTQRLNGAELLHQRVALAHALNRHCERKRDRRQKALGNKGNDHAQREDERRCEVVVNEQHIEQEERHAHAQCEQRYLFGEPIELTLERAFGLLHILREARDLTELGGHVDARDHARPLPSNTEVPANTRLGVSAAVRSGSSTASAVLRTGLDSPVSVD